MRKFSLFCLTCLCAISVQADYASGKQAFENGDWAVAVSELQGLAERGDSRAQYYMAYLYLNGLGTGRDDKKAVDYLQAAKEDNALAKSLLAYLYDVGRGVHMDKRQARVLYEESAEKGVVSSYLNLGIMYLIGGGVARDYTQAKEYFDKVDAKQFPSVHQYLARLYTEDSGFQDYQKALHSYKMAAKAKADGSLIVKTDPMDAYYMLGQFYQKGLGVQKNVQEAIKYYTYAAARNHGLSRYALGMLYMNSSGSMRNPVTGYAWVSLAADSGFAEAVKRKDDVFDSLSFSEKEAARQRIMDLVKQMNTATDPLASFDPNAKVDTSAQSQRIQRPKPKRRVRRRI